jgi:transposase
VLWLEQAFLEKKTFRAAERDRDDVKAKAAVFLEEISKTPTENLVFLDEAGVNLGMTMTHARAPIGERAFSVRPAGTQSNISLVGAIRSTGMCALYPYDGPVDGERFLSFLDNHLIPNLKSGDVVVMDNLRVHHISEVATRLEPVGAKALYLPPYSPEKNPIEEVWSLIKHAFRVAEARTIAAFIEAMLKARSLVTREKIEAYYIHAGYNLSR